MPVEVGAEQPAGHARDELRHGRRHGVDGGAGGPEAHGGRDAEQVDVTDPRGQAGLALHEGVVLPEIREVAQPRIRLVGGRRVAVAPARDVAGEAREFGAGRVIGLDAGGRDHEVGADLALRSREDRAAAFVARGEHRRALVQGEGGMARATVPGRLREALAHRQDAAHEAPAPRVVEVGEVAQEAREGEPAIGLDDLHLRPAAEQVHGRARLQRRRGVVERGSTCADHRQDPPGERREIDRIGRMRRKMRRHCLQNGQARPAARALLAGREHDFAGMARLGSGRTERLDPDEAIGPGRNVHHLGVVHDRQLSDVAEPREVLRPQRLRDQVERRPVRLAEARDVPRLVGEARHVEVGAGEVLGAAQGLHARVGEPWPLAAGRRLVEDEDVRDLGAAQPERDREAGLPAADHQDVERRGPVGSGDRFEPGLARMGDAREVAGDFARQSGEVA